MSETRKLAARVADGIIGGERKNALSGVDVVSVVSYGNKDAIIKDFAKNVIG